MGLDDIIIKLHSDLGDLYILLVTVRFSVSVNDELISRIKSIINNCSNCVIIVVPANMVLNYWHMVYPAYLSLRDSLRGTSRYKDPGIGALTYMAGTDQVKEALRLLSPVGNKDVSILIMGISDNALNAVFRVYETLLREALDIYVGVGAYKHYNGPWSKIEEFMTSLLTSYLKGYT